MKHLHWLFFLYSISGLGAVPILLSWTSSLKLLDSDNSNNITSGTFSTHLAIAVDYHYKRGEVYYSDGVGRIYRAWLWGENKSKDPIVVVEVVLVDGLAVDWQNDNLYWTDMTKKTVEMATIDGLERRVLFDAKDGLEKPRAVVLDPSEGLLFWSDWGKDAKVSSFGLDGKEKRTVSSEVLWPNGLTLDLNMKKLYILDGLKSTLSMCNYDGSDFKTILSSPTFIQQSFGLTYYANNLYWTSWKETILVSMNVESGDTSIVHQRSDWRRSVERLMGVRALHDSLQPARTQHNPCSDKQCSHRCLLGREGSASCVCPFGFSLNHDKKTCDEQGYFLVSWRRTIRRYNLEGTQEQPMIDSAKAAISLDYHLKKDLVFWSDIEEHRIYSAPLNQFNNMTMVVGVETCDGLAVDWVHDVLYWTNVVHNTLEAASLDGSKRTVLISENLDQPRAVALDPLHGLLFWSDWGTNPKIERADLDGSNRKTIISDEIAWPNGMTIDFDEKRIYWVDGKLKMISSCLYDGSERKQILGPQLVSLQPFGLSMLGDDLYWTDWGSQTLMKTSKATILGHSRKMANSSSLFLRPNGLSVVHSSRQREQPNPCNVLYCKGLCLGSPSDPLKARCVGEGNSEVSDVDYKMGFDSESNGFDRMTLNVGNDSFVLSGLPKTNSSNPIIIRCVKREGCSEDKRCSEGAGRVEILKITGAPITLSGLLPATKYSVDFMTINGTQKFDLTTKNNDPPELPKIKSVNVKGTHVTIDWDPVDTCVPDFLSYNYMIFETFEIDNLLLKGSTDLNEITLLSLQPEVSYTLHLYTSRPSHFTSVTFRTETDVKPELCQNEELFCDGNHDCQDGKDEDINVCAGISKITVYKKTKTEAHFRCDVTNRTEKNLLKFTGKYSVAESDVDKNFEELAIPCVVWPDSYCFYISALNASETYNFKISAVLKDGTVGNEVLASVFTKEGVPGPPEDLRVVSYASTNVEIQWRYPNQSNGVIRNFIMNIQEMETFEKDDCCMSFPITESPVEDEQPVYSAQPGGFSPASTYAISITSKTLYMGGSKEIDVHTPPPPMPILKTPELSVSSLTPVSWHPRENEPANLKTPYHSLIKAYLLILLAPKDHQQHPDIEIGSLRPVLEIHLGAGFCVLWNKNVDDATAFKEPIAVTGLTPRKLYKLAWVQVSQYKDVYGIDYILSESFIAV